MKGELSKSEFKRMYMKYRTEGDGWSDKYWDHFYERQIKSRSVICIEHGYVLERADKL